MIRLSSFLGLMCLAWEGLVSTVAMGCSSCGSGASDPIILFPNENYKLYLGSSIQERIRNIDTNGNVHGTSGIDSKVVNTISGAIRLMGSQASLSLTANTMENRSKDQHRSGLGDPLLALRYNIVNQSFERPEIPQVQYLLSHKFASGDSIHGSSNSEMLDIFTSGFDETAMGFDIWFGMWPVKFGTTLQYSYTHADFKSGRNLDPGDRWTWISTVGSVYENKFKLITGAIVNKYGDLKEDGELINNSDRYDRSWFLTFETLSLATANIRLNMVQQGLWDSKNSTNSINYTIAVMKGFL